MDFGGSFKLLLCFGTFLVSTIYADDLRFRKLDGKMLVVHIKLTFLMLQSFSLLNLDYYEGEEIRIKKQQFKPMDLKLFLDVQGTCEDDFELD